MVADFIKDANSIEQIVDGINTTNSSQEVKYFGEYKLDSGEKLAAHYAYQQVANYDHITDDEIKTHLETLKSMDARFNISEAMRIVRQFCNKCET